MENRKGMQQTLSYFVKHKIIQQPQQQQRTGFQDSGWKSDIDKLKVRFRKTREAKIKYKRDS